MTEGLLQRLLATTLINANMLKEVDYQEMCSRQSLILGTGLWMDNVL